MPKMGIDKKAKEEFYKIISNIKNASDVELFLKDLLSSSEIKDLARRLMAAKMLYNNHTYQEIRQELGMGMSTINKINFKTKYSKILPKLFD